MMTCLIWEKPKREELRIAIDMIVENCRNRYYGNDPLCPTGPALLGWAVIKAMANKSYITQEDFWVGRVQCGNDNKHLLITPRGDIVGHRPQHVAIGEIRETLKTNTYN